MSQFGPSTWIAIALGGALAVVAFVPFTVARYRRAGRLSAMDIVVLVLAALYATALWSYTLVPVPATTDYACAGQNQRPLTFITDIRAADGGLLHNRAFLQAAFNVLLFIPLGFFLRTLAGRGVLVATGIGFGISLLIELTQATGVWGLLPCAYRVFDVDDLLLNTFGAALGSLIALPIAVLLSRRRPAPRATSVTLGRRLTGMTVDVIVIFLIGLPLTIAWRAFALYLLGWPVDELPPTVDAAIGYGAPALVQGWWVFVKGRTLGEAAVQIEPVAVGRPVFVRRLIKFAFGVGGFLLLGAVPLPVPFVLPAFVLVTLVAAVRSREHRGLSHVIAGMELRVSR